MDSVPWLPLEAVRIEQGHEQLEVDLLPTVGGGGHEEKVARKRAEELPKPVPLGDLDLVAEVVGGHLVGLVYDHQVPICLAELRQDVLVPRHVIEAADDKVLL